MQGIVHSIILVFCLGGAAAFAQTQEQLIAGAKKEGALVVYASATAQQLQMYFTAFNKKYPFIITKFSPTGNQKLVSKKWLKEKAKHTLAVLVHTSVTETKIIKKKNGL